MECVRDVLVVIKDYDQSANDVERRHNRHDRLCYFRDTLHAAHEHKERDYCYNNAHRRLWNAKCSIERSRDRVGLYRIAHEAKRKDDQYPGSDLLDVDRGIPWNGYDLRRGYYGAEVQTGRL